MADAGTGMTVSIDAAVEDVAKTLWRQASSEYDYSWEANAETFRSQARELLDVALQHLPATIRVIDLDLKDETLDDVFFAGHTQARLGVGANEAMRQFRDSGRIA